MKHSEKKNYEWKRKRGGGDLALLFQKVEKRLNDRLNHTTYLKDDESETLKSGAIQFATDQLLSRLGLSDLGSPESREYLPKFEKFVGVARVVAQYEKVHEAALRVMGNTSRATLTTNLDQSPSTRLAERALFFLRGLGIASVIHPTAQESINALSQTGGVILVDHPTGKALDPAVVLQYLPPEIQHVMKIIAPWEQFQAYHRKEDRDNQIVPIGVLAGKDAIKLSHKKKYIQAMRVLVEYMKRGGVTFCMDDKGLGTQSISRFFLKIAEENKIPVVRLKTHTSEGLSDKSYPGILGDGVLSHLPGTNIQRGLMAVTLASADSQSDTH